MSLHLTPMVAKTGESAEAEQMCEVALPRRLCAVRDSPPGRRGTG